MLSGGLDSVPLLVNLLQETRDEIHAHHIELHTFEERDLAEADAILGILPSCREHYRRFNYICAWYVNSAEWSGLNITLAIFFAARLHVAMGDRSITLSPGIGNRKPTSSISPKRRPFIRPAL
jgi:hypothetical protein